MKYEVTFSFYAHITVEVEAVGKAEAILDAKDDIDNSLCHHCSRKIEMGDIRDDETEISCI